MVKRSGSDWRCRLSEAVMSNSAYSGRIERTRLEILRLCAHMFSLSVQTFRSSLGNSLAGTNEAICSRACQRQLRSWRNTNLVHGALLWSDLSAFAFLLQW